MCVFVCASYVGIYEVDELYCVDVVGKYVYIYIYISELYINYLCVSELCVSELYITELCGSKLCVSKGVSCVWEYCV